MGVNSIVLGRILHQTKPVFARKRQVAKSVKFNLTWHYLCENCWQRYPSHVARREKGAGGRGKPVLWRAYSSGACKPAAIGADMQQRSVHMSRLRVL